MELVNVHEMAKNKEFEADYHLEKLARTKVRKAKRREKHAEMQKKRVNPWRCTCGDPYWCFCGSNTPGVIDY